MHNNNTKVLDAVQHILVNLVRNLRGAALSEFPVAEGQRWTVVVDDEAFQFVAWTGLFRFVAAQAAEYGQLFL